MSDNQSANTSTPAIHSAGSRRTNERALAAAAAPPPPTTIALLRALATLGPRLHEATVARDAQTLYALVCQTLRACGLSAAFTELVYDAHSASMSPR